VSAIASYNNNTITTNQACFSFAYFFKNLKKVYAICTLLSELKCILLRTDKITITKKLLPYVNLKLPSMEKGQA